MSILKKAELEMAYLKAGIYGGAGSGKTFTAANVAIGLHKHIKSKKPIVFSDTETGSDFVLDRFIKAGINLLVGKSRAFSDLIEVGKEAEKISDIWIIDSITHFWNELMDAYQQKHGLTRITLRHWIPLKQTWREFSEFYVSSKLHIIMCGRAGDVWEDVQDEEGVFETKKTGTKMKAEVETAFEPSLLVEMVKHRRTALAGAGWDHRAWVVKDRFDIIDGSHFDNPKFKSFLPHIEKLNLKGKHKAIEPNRDSQEMFQNGKDGASRLRERDILIEKIEAEILFAVPGSTATAQVKTDRLKLMQDTFNSKSKKEISGMDNAILEAGLIELKNKNKAEEGLAIEEKKNNG